MTSLSSRFRSNLRAVHRFVTDRRARGDSTAVALLARLPGATLRRGYQKMARVINGRILQNLANEQRLRKFNADYAPPEGGHFYVIVMPGTLHFLLPCLALVPPRVKLLLIANGASSWECRMLERLRPELPLLRLRTLPGSSLSHGDMITLLLRENSAPFGIIDHDLYVFDQSIYDRLAFQPDEIALALFWDKGRMSGRPYPHTFFLYFQPGLLQDLMDRFQIDARIARRAPAALEKRLYEIGLFEGRFPKDYLDYFDTVQLLFAAAEAESYSWRPVERASSQDAVHLGGTSFSAYGAKDLAQLYIHLKFLEISCAKIQRHYAPLVAPYQSAAELLEQLSDAKQRSTAKAVDALIERLQSRLACAGDAGKYSARLKR